MNKKKTKKRNIREYLTNDCNIKEAVVNILNLDPTFPDRFPLMFTQLKICEFRECIKLELYEHGLSLATQFLSNPFLFFFLFFFFFFSFFFSFLFSLLSIKQTLLNLAPAVKLFPELTNTVKNCLVLLAFKSGTPLPENIQTWLNVISFLFFFFIFFPVKIAFIN